MHGEFLRSKQALGLGAYFLPARVGIFNVSVAGSHADKRGFGALAMLGYQLQTRIGLNFNFDVTATTRNFTYLGLQDDNFTSPFQGRVGLGFQLPDSSSVGVNFTMRNTRGSDDDSGNTKLLSASYGHSLFKNGYVNLSGISNVGGEENKSVFLSVIWAFGSRTSASISANGQKGANQGSLEISRSLPSGSGFGYDISAQQGSTTDLQATIDAQSNYGNYTLAYDRNGSNNAYRAGISGGVAVMAGDIAFSRNITDSFALVQTPGYADKDIYAFNQPVAKTNKNGNALITNLMPYQDNDISIAAKEFPLDAKIGATQMVARPYYRSGVLVRFSVKPANGAVMYLKLPSGRSVPTGMIMHFAGGKAEFPVVEDGEIYVTGLQSGKTNTLVDTIDGKTYHCEVFYKRKKNPLPNLGKIICTGTGAKENHEHKKVDRQPKVKPHEAHNSQKTAKKILETKPQHHTIQSSIYNHLRRLIHFIDKLPFYKKLMWLRTTFLW